eukprot:evm.model.scf_4956.1 EVM.evm.TU.scf_4956.1   scf_4956:1708-3562(-)
MAGWDTGGYASRDGLSSRSHLMRDSQLQINVGDFDLDREIDGLRSQVKGLKQVSQAIHEESQSQSFLMQSLEEVMERGRLALKQTMKRMNRVYEQAQSNHLLWLALFAFAIIMAIWFLSKMAHFTRMIFGG